MNISALRSKTVRREDRSNRRYFLVINPRVVQTDTLRLNRYDSHLYTVEDEREGFHRWEFEYLRDGGYGDDVRVGRHETLNFFRAFYDFIRLVPVSSGYASPDTFDFGKKFRLSNGLAPSGLTYVEDGEDVEFVLSTSDKYNDVWSGIYWPWQEIFDKEYSFYSYEDDHGETVATGDYFTEGPGAFLSHGEEAEDGLVLVHGTTGILTSAAASVTRESFFQNPQFGTLSVDVGSVQYFLWLPYSIPGAIRYGDLILGGNFSGSNILSGLDTSYVGSEIPNDWSIYNVRGVQQISDSSRTLLLLEEWLQEETGNVSGSVGA